MKNSIGCMIKQVDNIITREMIAVLKNKCIDLTPVQYWIILYLDECKEKIVCQKDIEDLLKIRRSTAHGILRNMEKNGLIKCDVHDRVLEVYLCPKSRKYIELFYKEIDKIEDKIKENISLDELNTFYLVLDKIKSNISE